uniref:Uncharacterized protein n=1 Tax=Timema douglasi TaxID=61478 RepID=A0A7R8VKC9_TIMDO|nr:unnamed protein product [Timema douglasi]
MEQLLYIVIIASLMGLVICYEKDMFKEIKEDDDDDDEPNDSPCRQQVGCTNGVCYSYCGPRWFKSSNGTCTKCPIEEGECTFPSCCHGHNLNNQGDFCKCQRPVDCSAWRSSDDMMVAFQVCLGVAFIIALMALFIQCCRSCICVKKTQTPSQIAAQRVSIISRPAERVIARLDPVRDPPPQYDDIQHIVLEKPPAYQEALADTSAQFNVASWDMDPPPYIVVDRSPGRSGVENLAFAPDDSPPVLGPSSIQPNSATSADHRVGTTNNTTQPLSPRNLTEARGQTFQETFNSARPEEPDINKQESDNK